MELTFILLALTTCAVWTKPIRIIGVHIAAWPVLLITALLCAYLNGYVEWLGIGLITLFALLTLTINISERKPFLYTLHLIAIAVFALLLGMNKLPGFSNPNIVTDLRFTPDDLSFTQRLRIDGVSAGILLLVTFGYPIRSWAQWRSMLRQTWPIMLIAATVVMGVALVFDFVALDFKFIPYTVVFFIANLLFTCVMEEVFFRGLLQDNLTKLLKGFTYGSFIAIGVTSLLFGLVHFKGGLFYVGLASLAGIFYGFAKYRTQHIEAAILTHFFVNAVHVVVFTYPNF